MKFTKGIFLIRMKNGRNLGTKGYSFTHDGLDDEKLFVRKNFEGTWTVSEYKSGQRIAPEYKTRKQAAEMAIKKILTVGLPKFHRERNEAVKDCGIANQ